MKRIFSLILLGCLLYVTAACSPDSSAASSASAKPAETTSASAETTTQTTPANTPTSIPTAKPTGITLANYPRVDGSTATIPLAIGLMQSITGCSEADAESATNFSMTDPSYYALAKGDADLLLVYEAATATRADLDVDLTMDVREIGLDALVFIVNADNPVESLTADQIRGIYSGTIKNWKDVGGKDEEIVAFQRPELSGSQTLMLELMMKDTQMVAPSKEILAESMADVIDDIASYDNSANAIGYSVYYYAKNMYTQPDLKFIAVDGVLPSNDSINSGEYGYSHPFYGILPLSPTPEASLILDWLLTPDGQKLIEDCGYVPILRK